MKLIPSMGLRANKFVGESGECNWSQFVNDQLSKEPDIHAAMHAVYIPTEA